MAFTDDILNLVNSTAESYTRAAYQAVVGAHSVEIHLVLVAYVALFGWGVMTQKIEMSLQGAARHILLLVFVFSLATKWDIFAIWMYDVFTNGPNKLVAALSGGRVNPNAQLGDVWDKGMGAAWEMIRAGGWSSVAPKLLGAAVAICTVLVVGYAMFLLVMAKFALAVLLAIAPLFLMLVLFESTRNFFTTYLAQVINFALIPVLLAGFLALALSIISLAIERFNVIDATNGFTVGSYVVLAEAIVFVLLMQVMGMASALGGGLQLATMGAVGSVARKLGAASRPLAKKLGGKLASGGRAAKNYVANKMGRGKSMVGRR